MEKTEAWVLRRGGRHRHDPGELERMVIDLPELGETDVLAEPIYGCWEANMTHALERDPVDVCLYRREPWIVLGNAGVLRILATGPAVTRCQVGDLCITLPAVEMDEFGHTTKVLAYDGRHTVGTLSKRVVWDQDLLEPLVWKEAYRDQYRALGFDPETTATRHSIKRWAGFPIRYTTAWDNWKLSFRVWRGHYDEAEMPPTYVLGWGGGVAFAELQLAREQGCQVAMTASTDQRLALLEAHGITPIDRRLFEGMNEEEEKDLADPTFRSRHHKAQKAFLDWVKAWTGGRGVSIFIDNIGATLFPTTLRSLGRMGIITTSGWRRGKVITYDRTTTTIGRQILIHSHGCQAREGLPAALYAETRGWLPPEGGEEYAWDDIPKLADDFSNGRLETYFPLYQVNPL